MNQFPHTEDERYVGETTMNDTGLPRHLLDLVPDAVFLYDDRGRYHYANRAAADFLHTSVEEMLGRTDEEIFPAAAAETIRRHQKKALETGERQRHEYPLEMPSGATRVWEVAWVPFSEEEVGFRGVAGIARDATERHRAARAVERAKRKYEAVFDLNPVSIVVIDAGQRRLLEVNRGFEELYGYGRDEVEGSSLSELGIFVDEAAINDVRSRALEGEEVRGELIRARRKDGEVRDVLLSCVRVRVEDELYLIGTAEDVSPLRRTARELRRRAYHDALTGLPNRDLLWDRCEHALKRARRSGEKIALVYLDLNGFKPVNDRYGHTAGDRVLREVGNRLGDSVRGEDTISRIGGDEFALLLEGIESRGDLRRALDRITEAFDAPFAIPDGECSVEASCGVVLVDPESLSDRYPDTDTADIVGNLIDRADREMYAAKAADDLQCRLARVP